MLTDNFDPDVVELMRSDVAALAADPAHALRLVLRLSGGFHAVAAQLRVTLGVGVNEYNAILALWDGGRCTMTELGHRIRLSRAAVTALTDRLEAAQLIIRTPDPTDRRRVFLSVTTGCEQLLFTRAEHLHQQLAAVAQRDPDAWATFARVGAQVREVLHTEAEQLRDRHADAPAAVVPARQRPPQSEPTTHWETR